MSLTKTDQSIATINYILKKKQKRVDEISAKLEISKSQKSFIGEEIDLIDNVKILISQVKKDINSHLGRIPPQATELEESVLGAIILESGAQSIIKLLEPIHFYQEKNKTIFTCIQEMVEKEKDIDLRSVVAYIRDIGKLDSIGGPAAIAELTASVVSSINIEYHARVLIEMAIKRSLISIGSNLIHDSYDTDCFDMLERIEGQLKTINSWIK